MAGDGSRPVLLALLSAALFGAATPASKVLLEGLSPFRLAGLLYLGAALGVLPAAARGLRARPPWRLDRANALRLGGAVLFGGVLGPVFLLLGLRLAPASSVSLWLNLELVATAVLGRLLFRDHLGRRGWIGVCAVVVAAALLSAGEGAASARAGALVLLACVCWGLDNHLTALIDAMRPAQSTFWKGLAAGTVNLTISSLAISSVASSATLARQNVPAASLALALLVGALSYGASIALYIASAQSLGATRGQMLFASAPFFGVALSAAFLAEPISATQVVAATLFAAGIAVLFTDRHAHAHAHEALAHDHMHRHDDGHHTHAHPGLPASTHHAHWHEHEPIVHAHPHWPDLHHRHGHRSPGRRGRDAAG